MKKRLSLLLAIVFALTSFSACGGSENTEETEEEQVSYSAEETAKLYVEAAYEGNLGKCYDLRFIDNVNREQAVEDYCASVDTTPDDFFESLCEQVNYGKEEDSQVDFDNYNEYLAIQNVNHYTGLLDYHEETYGKDWTVTVELGETQTVNESDADYYRSQLTYLVEKFEGYYSTDLEFDGDSAEEFLEIPYTVTIKGRDNENSEEGVVIAAKLGGKWKVCQCDADNYQSLGVTDVGFVPTGSYYY